MDGTVQVEMDAATTQALDAWRFAQDARWLFVLYGFAVFAIFATVRLKGLTLFWRALVFGTLAVPGVWYLGQMIHLLSEVTLF
jgi:hypothetical protein